ncbi:MAG: arginine--tRNA ligase [Candidatus Bathyarchaeia archaeon]
MERKISLSPFTEFREQCRSLLLRALEGIFPDLTAFKITLDIPPKPQFGELTSLICFEAAKYLSKAPNEVAEDVEVRAKEIIKSYPLIESVAAAQGYINFYANYRELSSLTVTSARTLDDKYGFVKASEPKRIIVEHTSVNPVHPIHIGSARNTFLGDSLARILEARGHIVSRHYYIDDVGRQSTIAAFGYKLLGNPTPRGKPDHFVGAIYAITNCLLEIRRLKKTIKQLEGDEGKLDETRRARAELDEWIGVAVDLQERFPDMFNKMLDALERIEEPEADVNALMRNYEAGDEEAMKLIREISSICLEGFKQTLERACVYFDSWDWESDFIWSGDVARYLDALKRTPYVFRKGEVFEFDAEGVARGFNLKKTMGLKEDYEIPSLTLGRSDGTTLYTTRDIAYSIWKFKRADKVINVIGIEQKLSQLQLKLALYALGYRKEADNLIHFAYNLVSFPGLRISGRRGRYITLDEVIDEAVSRAYMEVKKRSTELSEDEMRKISESVGIGAVKYALIETDPLKPVTFTWDRVVNFERNSGPYIQYTHARACSILRKASREVGSAGFSLLKEPIEREIVLMIALFPEIFAEAADNLKPNLIADFANSLADKFNTFYASLPVIKAEPRELSDARLSLVDAVRITLRNSLMLLGIDAPKRM